MSVTEKAFNAIKSIILFEQRIDAFEEKLGSLGDRVARLADSHASLRDRVSRIEGVIEGAAMASGRNSQPRIEG